MGSLRLFFAKSSNKEMCGAQNDSKTKRKRADTT